MESMGAKLNRMSGVQTEKNLFAPKNKMDKDAFLKMFTEQLKNQSPMNPINNDQFAQQIAMFSQLEQQINTNQNLEKMIQNQSNTQIAALQLVGRHVEADKASLYHSKDKPSPITFKLPQDASDMQIEILNPQGEKIRSINLGPQENGEIKTKWDGATEEGIPVETGKYTFKVVAKGVDGKPLNIASRIDGKVNGVTSEKGVTFLLVGDQKVALNDVETVTDTSEKDEELAKTSAKNGNLAKSPVTNAQNSSGTEPANVKSEVVQPAQGDGESPEWDLDSPRSGAFGEMPFFIR
jgi:flagellar basal-body rod modification protein FlgD